MSLQGAVIAFDLDGTLVDTAPDLIGTLNTLLADAGLPAVPLSAARHLVGHGARALLERGFSQASEPLDDARGRELFDRFIAVYLGRIAKESRPYDGVESALDRLAADGARLVVCTNKRTDLSLALLDALQLTSRFAAVVGADQAKQKPDPSLLRLAIQRADGEIGRAIFVGDSMIDQATARAAQVPVVGVSFGYVEAPLQTADFDAIIDEYAQLPQVACRLLSDRR
jgi:phosphoglycolate phosphatase